MLFNQIRCKLTHKSSTWQKHLVSTLKIKRIQDLANTGLETFDFFDFFYWKRVFVVFNSAPEWPDWGNLLDFKQLFEAFGNKLICTILLHS